MAVNKNVIVLASNPKGLFEEAECTVAITPGTVVQIDTSEGLNANGRYSIELFAAGDGGLAPTLIAVEPTVNDPNALVTTDYAINTNARVYWPALGEDFNMVVGDSETPAFGNLMVVDSGTGDLNVASGSTEDITPFICLESSITAGNLVHVKYIGQGGSIA